MGIIDNGTTVWVVETTFPYLIIEGNVKHYSPQKLYDNTTLKYYQVYFEVYDRLYLYAHEQLFVDREKAVESRKGLIRRHIQYTQSSVEEYEQDIERILSDINEMKQHINELEKLLKDE